MNMMTKEELANDPDIVALSGVDDVLLPMLSPMTRAVIMLSRRLVVENRPCATQ